MTALLGAAGPNNRVVGLDIDERLIHYARAHHGSATTTFTVGSIDVLPPEPTIDLLVSVDVLHHVGDTAALYRSVAQRLRPAGRWIVFEPNVFHPAVTWSQERMKRAGLGEDHFRPRREATLMQRCGLAVERRSYLLAGPQRASISARLDRVGRVVERCPVIGSSVALVVTHGDRC